MKKDLVFTRSFCFIVICFTNLLCFEGKQSRNSCTLDSFGKLSLVLCASAAHSAGQHFAAFGYELFKAVNVLIVDNFYLFLAENAHLFARNSLICLFCGRCRSLIFFHNLSPLIIRREYRCHRQRAEAGALRRRFLPRVRENRILRRLNGELKTLRPDKRCQYPCA